jgi:hypothetical protein
MAQRLRHATKPSKAKVEQLWLTKAIDTRKATLQQW